MQDFNGVVPKRIYFYEKEQYPPENIDSNWDYGVKFLDPSPGQFTVRLPLPRQDCDQTIYFVIKVELAGGGVAWGYGDYDYDT